MGKVAVVPAELEIAKTESLDQIAARIRDHYAEFLSRRWMIGALLIMARDKCKAEGKQFLAWVRTSGIDKSKAEVYRLMHIAGAADPVMAAEDFNEKHRRVTASLPGETPSRSRRRVPVIRSLAPDSDDTADDGTLFAIQKDAEKAEKLRAKELAEVWARYGGSRPRGDIIAALGYVGRHIRHEREHPEVVEYMQRAAAEASAGLAKIGISEFVEPRTVANALLKEIRGRHTRVWTTIPEEGKKVDKRTQARLTELHENFALAIDLIADLVRQADESGEAPIEHPAKPAPPPHKPSTAAKPEPSIERDPTRRTVEQLRRTVANREREIAKLKAKKDASLGAQAHRVRGRARGIQGEDRHRDAAR